MADTASGDLRLVRLTKTYGDTAAVDDLSLTIPQGSFFALLGPSGCGKTTTLRMVAGLEQPTQGAIHLGETDISGMKPYKRPVNTVFQSYALFPHLDIFENVAFGLRRRGIKDVGAQVAGMLELVELTGFEKRKPNQLSGGQQQRDAVARALINHPSLLLLDEPLGALDLKLRRQMQLELKRIQTEVGITFVHVTHDQEEAMTMADTVAVMNEGRIEQLGSPVELYENPMTAFVANFLGRRLSYTYEVVELVPGRRLVMRTSEGPFPMETSYTWEPTPDGFTRMPLRNRGTPTGFSRWMAPFMSWAMRRANQKDLACLKALLEGGADGSSEPPPQT